MCATFSILCYSQGFGPRNQPFTVHWMGGLMPQSGYHQNPVPDCAHAPSPETGGGAESCCPFKRAFPIVTLAQSLSLA